MIAGYVESFTQLFLLQEEEKSYPQDVIPFGYLKCEKCFKIKPNSMFSCWRAGDNVKRNRCKQCVKEYKQQLKIARLKAGNPPTPPIGTPCMICEEARSTLCFDHDHLTMKHRGWLCSRCNKVLGQVQDNIKWLSRAVDYLEDATNGT